MPKTRSETLKEKARNQKRRITDHNSAIIPPAIAPIDKAAIVKDVELEQMKVITRAQRLKTFEPRPDAGQKRKWYLTWDEYFMGVALIAAQRSKDPDTQVGCCIVNPENRIISTGYNGMPNLCNDDDLPWIKGSKEELQNKHLYVCHSEMNAIVHRTSDVKKCTIYVTLYPCNECAKIIVQSGITDVVYYKNTKRDTVATRASKKLLDQAGVKVREYKQSDVELSIGTIVDKVVWKL